MNNVEWNPRRGGCTCKESTMGKSPTATAKVATVANICTHGMNHPRTVEEMFKGSPDKATFASLLVGIMGLWAVAFHSGEDPEHVFAYMVTMEDGDSVLRSRDDDEHMPHLYWNMCDTAVSDRYSEPIFNYGFHTRISVLDYVCSEMIG
jgi:hypothetical protein